MRYLSLFSGIEAATQAFHPLGWEPAAFAEIEPFPAAVLAHHYPEVPNLGNVTNHKEWPDIGTVDVVCGGSPCQSFSVAGLRQGMADPRGNLALVYLAIVDQYRPKWVIYENVPGLLSSNGGRDFGAFLGGLAQLGYGIAYRVLDAQFVRTRRFGGAVPQRRRRVFVVGYLGDWRRAAAVLFDRESLRGDPPPRREAGQRPAPTLASRTRGGGGLGTDFDLDGGLISMAHGQGGAEIGIDHGPTPTCNHEAPIVAHSLRAEGFDASEDGTGRGTPLVPVAFDLAQITSRTNRSTLKPVSPTLMKDSDMHAMAFDLRGREGGAMPEGPHDTANIRAASGGSSRSYVAHPWAVRRLTPRECERLQGFPDDYTLIPYRRGMAADGPRYKALGNSFAVNVVDWIGQRIEMVDAIQV